MTRPPSNRDRDDRPPAPVRTLPVYAEAALAAGGEKDSANLGLIYDRYLDIWSGPPHWKPRDDARRAALRWFQDAAARSGGRAQLDRLVSDAHHRREQLWTATGATRVPLTLAAPFASGLGMSHPAEVGFVWDRNLGVPYLPGGSVKGAARAWAEVWLEDERAARIFGPRHTSADQERDAGPDTGSVIFHALYPRGLPRLRVDVLNPHFKEYYEDRENKVAPGDWLSPVPIFFLTVEAGAAFVTAVQGRPGADPNDATVAAGWLRDALTTIGAGAKTAAGYGLFRAG